MYFSSVFFLQKERGLAADKVKRNLFGGWLPEPNDPWRKETCIITLRWHLSNSLERNYATTSTSDKEDKYSMLEQKKKTNWQLFSWLPQMNKQDSSKSSARKTTPLASP
jgi:hypothetical protein